MSAKTWFQQKLNALKDSFDFRLETQLYDLTEKICRKMDEKGINRTQLANRLDVTPAAITKILKGNSNFTLKTLLSLADALEMDLKIEFEEKNLQNYQIILKSASICRFEELRPVGSGSMSHILGTSSTNPFPELEKKDPERKEHEPIISQTV